MEKIGIVGSREFGNMEMVREYVRSLVGLDVEVVSGGCWGVDEVVMEEVEKLGLRKRVFEGEWNIDSRGGGMMRNDKLVKYCEKVVVFWDGKSKGSKDVIDRCKKYYVKCEIKKVVDDFELGLWG